MAKHRTHSIAFKRQVVQEYLSGETMHGLAKRHDLSRNLIRIWVQKYEAGGLDVEPQHVVLGESEATDWRIGF
jgi:transposase-like protein